MFLTDDRNGHITKEDSFQDRFLEFLYTHMFGRLLLRPLVCPVVSKLGGVYLDSVFSKWMIAPFIRSHSISMNDYEQQEYRSYNDFFKRRLSPKARKMETSPDILISPCDSRVSVYSMDDNAVFSIKHTRYTVASLLRNKKLAKRYAGGYLFVFRLCVDDYHRYIYVDQGKVSRPVRISGVFHTVNPIANDFVPVYKENTREYSLLLSKHFGTLLQMEVGALLVGKIENHTGKTQVMRGEEKGNFAFGGSTIILMVEKDMVIPDGDLLENSKRGIETKVKLGEHIGRRKSSMERAETERTR